MNPDGDALCRRWIIGYIAVLALLLVAGFNDPKLVAQRRAAMSRDFYIAAPKYQPGTATAPSYMPGARGR